MSEELLINVNVNGEENINKVSENLGGVEKTSKKAANAMGDFRRAVRDAKGELLTLEEGTKEYNAALQKVAAAQDKMRDMSDKIKASQRDLGVVAKNVAGAISGLAGGFSAATGLVGLFGEINEDTAKSILKVQAALSVASGIAQFVDAFDSMKDLLGGAKIAFMQLITAKQADTVATVENTVANEAEAAAIASTSAAAQSSSKIMWASVGMYAAIAVAIGVAIYALVKLINKMNEIPKDVEFKLKMNEDVSKSMVDVYTKAKQFAYDYNNAVRSGNKERINALAEFGKKNFDLHKNQLKQIGENVDAWRLAFKSYIDMAKLAYQQEYLIKKSAEADVNVSSADYKRLALKQELLKSGNGSLIKRADELAFDDSFYLSANKLLRDYIDSVKDYSKAQSEAISIGEQLTLFEKRNAVELANLRSKSTPAKDPKAQTLSVKQFKSESVNPDFTDGEANIEEAKFNINKLIQIYRDEYDTRKEQADKFKVIQDTIGMGETERILYQIKTIKENLPKLQSAYDEQEGLYKRMVTNYSLDVDILNEKINNNNKTYDADIIVLNKYENDKAFILSKIAKEQENFNNSTTNDQRDAINVKLDLLDTELKANDNNLEIYKRKLENLKKQRAELEKEKSELDKTPDQIEAIKNKLLDINGQIAEGNAALIQSERDKWQSLASDVKAYLDALGSVTAGVTAIFQAQQTEIDSTVAGYEQVADGAAISQTEIDKLKTSDAETYASAIAAKNGTDEDRAAFVYSLEQKAYEAKVKILEKQKKWEIASAWISFASGTVGIWSKAFTELGPIAAPIVATIETAGLLATTLASIKTINSQRIDAPTPPSATGSSAGSASTAQVYQSALNPTASTLTSNQENLNKMNNSGGGTTVVKVSEINDVQQRVKVQQNNSSF